MNQGGFTLVEVLVAMVAAALITASAHRGLALLADLEERSAAQRQHILRAAAVRRQLTSWLRSAYISGDPDSPGFAGRDRRARDGEPQDLLGFPTLAPGPFQHGTARVRLGIDSDALTPGKGLMARVTLVPRGERARSRPARSRNRPGRPMVRLAVRPGTTQELVLVPEATGLDVRYLFDRGNGAEWFTSWVSTVQLPEAIDLRILGDSVPQLLRIPILIPLGGGG